MSECEFANQLSAYHDGELPPGRLAAFQQHLSQCAACTANLAKLDRLSGLLQSWPMPDLSAQQLRQIHFAVDRANFRHLQRLALSLASMAASLAIAAVVWANTEQPAAITVAAAWERVAVAPSTADDSSSGTRDLSLAKWVLADLSSGDR